ncbi:MAG: hypothetical protein SWX82_30960 [Cyanobacteriota bacterium]|nr:hypothetical protein [Cyanobacteriota bacterium]
MDNSYCCADERHSAALRQLYTFMQQSHSLDKLLMSLKTAMLTGLLWEVDLAFFWSCMLGDCLRAFL